MKDTIYKKHLELFSKPSLVLQAPGRANIIGEHTDYNDGFVLPFAIDRRIYFTLSNSHTDTSTIHAYNIDSTDKLIAGNSTNESYLHYFETVLQVFNSDGIDIAPVNIVFGGDLPIGAGVSSSSALTCGFVSLINQLHKLNLSKLDIVSYASRAEKGTGLDGGIMDQFTVVNGQKEKAILLDCQDNSYQFVNIPTGDFSFCLFDTNVPHRLQDSEYNTRTKTCKSALQNIKDKDNSVHGFRDLDIGHIDHLDGTEKMRIRHLLNENSRVHKMLTVLQNSNLDLAGKLLNDSHESLKTDYQVSCDELDFIAEYLQIQPEVSGARMMGGGFGGAVISLMKTSEIDKVRANLSALYQKEFGLLLDCYPIRPEQGISFL